MPFLAPLRVEHIQGQIGAVLVEPFGYQSPEYDLEIWVEAGFSTDFGSVPSFIADAIVPAIGQTPRAFVTHDWLYSNTGLVPNDFDGVGRRLDRRSCDDIMRLIMVEEGIAPWRAWTAFAGVRIGGRWPWRRYMDINHMPLGI